MYVQDDPRGSSVVILQASCMYPNFEIVARPSRARGFSYIGGRVLRNDPAETTHTREHYAGVAKSEFKRGKAREKARFVAAQGGKRGRAAACPPAVTQHAWSAQAGGKDRDPAAGTMAGEGAPREPAGKSVGNCYTRRADGASGARARRRGCTPRCRPDR